jgi:GAF domain-containing protein
LDAAERLTALALSGLGPAPDESFDRFAELVRGTIGVPVALVSLVDPVRQFFPGAAGLGQPWCDSRQTPLSHSFCQVVVASTEPLVIADARRDSRVADSLAIPDLGVIAYAGMPLTDADGTVLGSLCAIDHEPRHWSDRELSLLASLAAACSAEIRLRISGALANRSDDDRARLVEQVQTALTRSHVLLEASEAMAAARSLTDVAVAAERFISSGPRPAFTGIGLIDHDAGVLRMVVADPDPDRGRWSVVDIDSKRPSTTSLRENRAIFYDDRQAVLTDFPDLAEEFSRLGFEANASIPLRKGSSHLGVLMFAWSTPHRLDVSERSTITALAAYTAQAVDRLVERDQRVRTAEILQRAMLTELPHLDRLQVAARYQPAHAGDQVGGDWYDAIRLPGGDSLLVVGDVAGHDMRAAGLMGQYRSMLRGYAVDRDEPPAQLLQRLDHATDRLGLDTIATAVVARITELPNGYRLAWANAGHPPPILVEHHGWAEVLDGRDPLLGFRRSLDRSTQLRELPVGSTVLFYTDGLVETRDVDMRDRIGRVAETMSANIARPLDELVDAVIDRCVGDGFVDDVVVLACRLEP